MIVKEKLNKMLKLNWTVRTFKFKLKICNNQ